MPAGSIRSTLMYLDGRSVPDGDAHIRRQEAIAGKGKFYRSVGPGNRRCGAGRRLLGVALRGDPPEGMGAKFTPHPEGFQSSVDLISAIRHYRPELGKRFEISVAAYPEPHPDSLGLAKDLEILKAKQDAGADRAITQFFFEPDHSFEFLDAARGYGIDIQIVPGIMLQPNFNGLKRIATLCGATLPSWLHELYEGLEDDAEQRELITANVAADLTMKLADRGVKDFHFYTLNKAGLSLATCRLLGIKPEKQAA